MTSPVFQIRVIDLEIDDALNPRFRASYDAGLETPGYEQASLRALAESMRSGQLQNIGVDKNPKTGRWRVRYGFRRAHAAKLIGLETLDAKEVSDPTAPLAENVGRKNLFAVETVCAIKGLLELKNGARLTHEQIGQRIGLSRTAVTNYATIARKLHPSILDQWKRRPGLFTVQQTLQASALAPAKQLAWLHSFLGNGQAAEKPTEPDTTEEETERAPREVAQVPASTLRRLRERLDAGRLDHRGSDWCEGATAVLEALLSGKPLR